MIPLKPLAALAALVFGLCAAGPAAATSKVFGAPVAERPVVIESTEPKGYSPPRVEDLGGPFTLTDHTGRTVTQDSFEGRWLVLTFGFPGCRESCPVALDSLSKALDLLGPDAARVQTLFVDVSMDRKPDHRAMAQFLSNFHESIVGLGGTRLQVNALIRKYKVRRNYAHTMASAKETGPRIDHSSYVFLIDPQRRTRSYFYHDLPGEQMAEKIRAAVRGG